MKHDYKVYVLAVLVGILFTFMAAPTVFAYEDEECRGHGCHEGGDSSSDSSSESYSESDADAEAYAEAYAESDSEAYAESYSDAGAEASADTNVTVEGDVFEAADVKGAAEVLQRRAATAPDSRSRSAGNNDACGDSTGLSGQAGILGGSLSTVPEACRAFRGMASERQLIEAGYTRRAKACRVIYWIGFPFRSILHVASFGILN